MIFKFVVWFILGLVCWLNLQPWLGVGAFLASTGLTLPFEGWLLTIPVVRGIVEFLVNSAASLFAVALWLTVQTLQVMALISENETVRSAFTRLFSGIPLSQWVAVNAKTVGRLGWGAYLLEGFVCFLAYPPYGEGMSDFLADFGIWDPYLLSWPDMALLAVTILLFEGFVWLSCFFYGMLMLQPQQQPQPRPQQQPR